MKKQAFFPCLLAAICLTACGTTVDSSTSEVTTSSEAASAATAAEPTETEPISAEFAEDSEVSTTESKMLVVYFSATGTTKEMAEEIAAETGADLFEIVPVDPYTDADLDYSDANCRANQEQNDSTARPAISGSVENWDTYDVIFIGYPIWWGIEPRIVDTFLESYDFSGKTMIPFCTSGGSGINASATNLKAMTPEDTTWLSGRRFSGSASESSVLEWVDSLGIASGM